MRSIIIVGTSHSIQTAINGPRGRLGKGLERFLVDLCRSHAVSAIAEEMSVQALRKAGRRRSIPLRVSAAMALPHRFCDPNDADRDRLGICKDENLFRVNAWTKGLSDPETDELLAVHYAKREAYWLQALEMLDTWPVLFVCGATHVNGFSQLVDRAGHHPVTAATDWQAPGRLHGA